MHFIQTSQTGGQLYSDTPSYKVNEYFVMHYHDSNMTVKSRLK